MKEENYLWHIGRFHRAHMGQSIPWIVIGWIISLDMLVHKYQPSVQLKLLVLWIVSLSLIVRPIHSALCYIEAKSFVNY